MSVSDEVEIELTLEAEANNVDQWDSPKGDSIRTAAETQGVAKTLVQFREAARDTASAARRFSAEILGSAGMKLLHHGKFADGLEFYRLAADLNPSRPGTQAALGEAYLMNGRRAEAVASFRRAVALDSLNTVAREYLRQIERR